MVTLQEAKEWSKRNCTKEKLHFEFAVWRLERAIDSIDRMFEAAVVHEKYSYERFIENNFTHEYFDSLTKYQQSCIFDGLADEKAMADDMINLVGEMQILALYKTTETEIKTMLKVGKIEKAENLLKKFNVTSLSKIYPIEKIKNYDAFNELRLLNNIIKHNNCIINKELADLSGLTEGEEIASFNQIYERLRKSIIEFTNDLKDQLFLKLKNEQLEVNY